MPDDLASLIRLILEDIATQMAGVESGHLSVDAWQQIVARSLIAGHYAAYMVGKESKELSEAEQKLLNKLVGEQLTYLNRFASDMDDTGWMPAYNARGALYAGALKSSYSQGKWREWDLPWHPGDGSTQCLGSCLCHWELDIVDAQEREADARWVLGGTEHHCTTCPQRSADSPYRVQKVEAA
jgi:hypothetical protein